MAGRNVNARKQYMVWWVTERRRKDKLRAIEYKGGKCERCGYCKCPAALTFHHPEDKNFGISSGNTRAWEKTRAELDRCVLLCSNCHHEVHYEEHEQIREEKSKAIRKLVPMTRGRRRSDLPDSNT